MLARIIEPTSKADTVRVRGELGVPGPSQVTFMRCLKRAIQRDYQTVIAIACYARAVRDSGPGAGAVRLDHAALRDRGRGSAA